MAKTPAKLSEAAAPSPRAGLVLYVDCITTTGERLPDLGPVVDRLAAEVAAEHGVSDIIAIDFGKWRAPLRAKVRALELDGPWSIRSNAEISGCALEALRPFAGTIVQGLR